MPPRQIPCCLKRNNAYFKRGNSEAFIHVHVHAFTIDAFDRVCSPVVTEGAVKTICAFLVMSLAVLVPVSMSQERNAIGYADTDADGVNDLFRDADGDGINDVTDTGYSHRFPFMDDDGDGVNDLFRDADGDGVNDLVSGSGTASGPAMAFPVIDSEGDGLNDVTGEKYVRKISIRSFIDENGDGIDDREALAPVKSLFGKIMSDEDDGAGRRIVLESIDGPTMDRFIDENGDGINDGRTFNDDLMESFSNEP